MKISEQAISRLSTQHQSIRVYIDGLPAATLHRQYQEDVPPIHEIIAYLCRYQYVWFERVKSMCRNLNPCFSTYDAQKDPHFRFMIAKTNGCLVRELFSFREDITGYIKALPGSYGSRIGTHAVFGRMCLNEWIEFFLLHESRELFKIFKLSCAIRSAERSTHDVINMPWLKAQSG